MSHRFYNGEVFHKRFKDADHKFTYGFFMLDIDVNNLETLKNKLFSYNSWNLFSFFAKDHFGKGDSFLQNIEELLEKFNLVATKKMRFITLPRIANYVFNPISVLVLFDADVPTQLLVEVHNYNGGRIVYPVKLEKKSRSQYEGEAQKDMYVSPFLKRDGLYKFSFEYSQEKMALGVYLYEDDVKTMMTTFRASSQEFSTKSVVTLFVKHLFLTFRVVTRTLWQSLKLYRLGLKFNSVTAVDEQRRY
ncbi:MAG: DUF1365 family protein [Sulfurimonas sp.]|jgi:DUF1365 family protein|uniref:DUF1365 domain-containing protein n=1 Tax=Sulfurimonas sp. TaxID=2022749 RepID=UPI0039E6354E